MRHVPSSQHTQERNDREGRKGAKRDVKKPDTTVLPSRFLSVVRAFAVTWILVVGAAFAAGPTTAASTSVRFVTADVIVQSPRPLAAWRVELKSAGGNTQVVGVEGGAQKEAYRDPPYYDPAALANSRIILGSFSTEKEPPQGDVHVARVHLRLTGDCNLSAITIEAVGTDLKPIAATALVRLNKQQEKETGR